ncbi:MAG: class I SAM-dependent methyltransferase [Bryobacteraceae bacterium]
MRKLRFLIPAVVLLAGGIAFFVERGPDPADEAARLAGLMHIEPGATVADIGAGAGRLSIPLSRLHDGRVHLIATELGAEKLDALRASLDKASVRATVVASGAAYPNLPGACCDAIVLRHVFHHIERPGEFTGGLAEGLRPAGRVAIVDFSPSPWRFWMPRHGVATDLVKRAMAAAGFELEAEAPWGVWDYCLVFRRLRA